MIKKFPNFVFLLSLVFVCYGEEGAVFLNITPGARAIGMAQCFTAIADDATACYYNPAGLAFISQPQMLSMNLSPPIGFAKVSLWSLTELAHPLFSQKVHSPLDPNGSGRYIYWAAVTPLGSFQGIGISIDYLNSGETDIISPNGEYLGTYFPYDCALGISYSRKIISNLSLGLSTKYIYEFLFPEWVLDSLNLPFRSSVYSFAIDSGFLFKTPWGLSIGASLLNLGPPIKPIKLDDTSRDLPLTLRIGIAQSINDLLKVINTDKSYSAFQIINRLPIDFHIVVERKFDLAGGIRNNNTAWGFEAKILNVLSYRQGFGITREENPIFANPKSIGVDLKIAEFDITVTNSDYYAGCWWIQSKFKPLENRAKFLQENKTLDHIFFTLSCLAIPGGGHLYNGQGWKAMPFLAASFLVADAILERDSRPSYQVNIAFLSIPVLYLVSGIEAHLSRKN